MPYENPRAWVRLRVIGFEGFGVRLGRPLYLEAGSRAADVRDWHFTTQTLRAWVGVERDARPLIRAAADSCDWDFDLAIEVGEDPVQASPRPVTRGESTSSTTRRARQPEKPVEAQALVPTAWQLPTLGGRRDPA